MRGPSASPGFHALYQRLWLALMLVAGVPALAWAQTSSTAPRAEEVLRAMSDELAKAKRFSFHAELSFDRVMGWGGKVQFAGGANFVVVRPNRIHVDFRDDLAARTFWYDGESVTIFDPDTALYAVEPAKVDIDTTVDHLQARYGLALPFGELLSSNPYRELTACHHLSLVQDDVDWQIWVELGERPLPLKFVVTFKQLPSAPQFGAVLMDWDLDAKPQDAVFRADLPAEASKIDFLEARAGVTP
jgi:hypothetical protein